MDNRKESAAAILGEWADIRNQLESLFRVRDQKNTKKWVEKGIHLFLQFLYLTNHEPFTLLKKIPFHQLPFKPVNLEERLEFIQSRPGLYHSYRQLTELFTEQEKQFVKSNIVKKSSRP